MEQTWRWYGPKDPITLADIRQTGATGIVTALHEIPIGEIWPLEAILSRRQMIEESGLKWSVVESIPVSESIKTGKIDSTNNMTRQNFISNYKQSIINMSKAGLDILCYNFMPVVDWTRTDLEFEYNDGSNALKFDFDAFAAFDIFLMRRTNAQNDYTPEQYERARKYCENLDDANKTKLINTIIKGLPGRTSEAYTMSTFVEAVSAYDNISVETVRKNLFDFIRQIAPIAESHGVFLAIHPDDPPIPLLGLPRIVSTALDVRKILDAYPSPHNGLTMCVGSYASRVDNKVEDIVNEFADKVNFVHLRNVRKVQGGSFVESDHIDGDVDMFKVISTLLFEQDRRKKMGVRHQARLRLPFRPDHGHQMLDDLTNSEKQINPGYTAIGRLRGLAELRGLQYGILRNSSALLTIRRASTAGKF